MKKKFRTILFLFLFFLPMIAVSLGGGTANDNKIPLPEKNFKVSVTDTTGNKFSAGRVTVAGKVYLKGFIGKAKATVPFEKIKSIKISPIKGKTLMSAQIFLKNGEEITLMFAPELKAYGETKFGQFEIFVGDITSIEFP